MDEKREFLKVPEVAEVLRIARSRANELVSALRPVTVLVTLGRRYYCRVAL